MPDIGLEMEKVKKPIPPDQQIQITDFHLTGNV